jgi:DNA helicase II / ATP-dependent DNA helicase PcrA
LTISQSLMNAYPDLNPEQKAIVGHTKGPLLVIAGPGSGKTHSLTLRAMNLLLLNEAAPKEIILCTFTEKAAFELRDRVSASARKIGFKKDLSELQASTIHGLCHKIISQHRHRTPLGSNFETLDELTQLLFIYDHFDKIIGHSAEDLYLQRWKTKWGAIEGARDYFNKITEELVDPTQLSNSKDEFLRQVSHAYLVYQQVLYENNRIDFAHLQRLTYDLLLDPDTCASITSKVGFIMVDEYQDTNYVQEQILLKLSEKTGNLCVVGDEDQSLYRFRGATVRNILEFPQKVKGCTVVTLTTNYRSHRKIIEAYDRWMGNSDWANPHGPPFRYPKKIRPDDSVEHPEFPAVFCIWGKTKKDETERFSDLVAYLMGNGVISDYGQVALLLHSVRHEHSGPYLDALQEKGIPAFCPRARGYFDNDEVRLMVGCFAVLFGYYGEGRGKIAGPALQELTNYVDSCIVDLGRRYGGTHPLAEGLQDLVSQVAGLQDGEALDIRPADFFYRLLALDPFSALVKDENAARNLAIFSQLLNVFQNYYHYTVITYRNREIIRFHLFNSFLRLLYEGGINEYEDPDQPLPKGYVQVMTIHQAKGLEFPVVVVGSLDKQLSTSKHIDRDLEANFQRPPFEPMNRITHFDRMRLHYVAFSRAEKVLVLSSENPAKDHFTSIWQGLPQWPYVERDLLGAQRFNPRERVPLKRSFSFTGDLKVYETCPRQYQFFREYDFTPSRSAVIFFGLLVHQTIEEIHRTVLEGKQDILNREKIRELMDRNFRFLCLSDVRPIGDAAREGAFER